MNSVRTVRHPPRIPAGTSWRRCARVARASDTATAVFPGRRALRRSAGCGYSPRSRGTGIRVRSCSDPVHRSVRGVRRTKRGDALSTWPVWAKPGLAMLKTRLGQPARAFPRSVYGTGGATVPKVHDGRMNRCNENYWERRVSAAKQKTVAKSSFSVPQARLARPATPGPGSPVDAAQTPFFVQKHEDDGLVKSMYGELRVALQWPWRLRAARQL